MKTFQFFPEKETVQAFNDRLAVHCQAENVVDVKAQALRDGSLLLALTHDQDLVIFPPMLLQPMVVPYQMGTDLAKLLNTFSHQVEKTATEEDPRATVSTIICERTDGAGYAVVLVNVGAIEVPEEGDDNAAG